MRTEKTTNKIATEEALEKVQEVMKRIDRAKENLRGEYNEVCKEIERRISGKPSIRIGKAGFLKTAEYYLSDEDLVRKRNQLKTALELPYYADEEYRECSLVYVELITNEAMEQYADLEKRREENYKKLIEYRRCVTELSTEHREIGGAIATKYVAIGLGKFGRNLIYGNPFSNYAEYKEHCKKYND